MTPNRSGFALIEKPEGVTSFEALSPIKKKVKPLKVGHTGTLDKFAQGLLIVVIGKFTRFAPYITELGKTYISEFEFGKETDTLDPEGEVTGRTDLIPDLPLVTEKVKGFVGEQIQVPPIYSALHVDGKRASERARAGENPEIKGRNINMYSVDILEYIPPVLRLQVSCSKGTYIRALARDLGHSCGSFAYVKSLKRVNVGNFSVDDAVSAEEFSPERDVIPPLPFFKQLDFIRILQVKNEYIHCITHGKPLQEQYFHKPAESETQDGMYAAFTQNNDFAALLKIENGKFSYKFVGAS